MDTKKKKKDSLYFNLSHKSTHFFFKFRHAYSDMYYNTFEANDSLDRLANFFVIKYSGIEIIILFSVYFRSSNDKTPLTIE